MKLLSAEVDLGSANNISKAPIVRIYNTDSSAVTLTRKNNVETTLGSYTIPPGKVIYCQKAHTDTLEGGAALKATAIGYSEMLDIISVGGGAAAYSDGEIYSTNLLYHLDANNSSSYESGDGDTWTDLVAGTNNATIYGATHTEGPGDNGYYFDFDGIDDYVTMRYAAYTLGANFAVEVWARNDNAVLQSFGVNTGNSVYSSAGNETWTQSDIIHLGHDRAEVSSNSSSSDMNIIYDPAPSTQAWHQYIVNHTYTFGMTGDVKIYIDKTEVASKSDADYHFGAKSSALGRRTSTGIYDAHWDGQISIFRVYSEPLTTTQIETNYDAHKGRYGLS